MSANSKQSATCTYTYPPLTRKISTHKILLTSVKKEDKLVAQKSRLSIFWYFRKGHSTCLFFKKVGVHVNDTNICDVKHIFFFVYFKYVSQIDVHRGAYALESQNTIYVTYKI
jgi:hypothetical protein